MRLHARTLTPAAFALLTAASISVATCPPVPEGYARAPEGRVCALPDVLVQRPAALFPEDFARLIQKESGARRPSEASTRETRTSSDLYLLVTGADGEVFSGSGTVIRGDHPLHRVLTATHVLTDDEGRLPSEVIAFSAEGRAVARMEVEAVSPQHLTRFVAGQAAGLINDQAVLSPTEIYEGADQWNARGAVLAAAQPAHALFLSTPPLDSAMDRGVSGASLRNSADEVVGVISQGGGRPRFFADLADTSFLSLVRAHDAEGDYARKVEKVQTARQNPGIALGLFGLASPVVGSDVLEALGVEGVVPDPSVSDFEARFSGFPGAEPRSAAVYARPMRAYEAQRFLPDGPEAPS